MTRHDEPTPADDLRQRLLELAYGLLSDDEAAELRRRIAADPEVARRHDEAQRACRLLAAAARLDAPPLRLVKPEETMRPSPAAAVYSLPNWAKIANVALALAAAVLILCSVALRQAGTSESERLAQGPVRLVIAGPAKPTLGVENRYVVTALSSTGVPLAGARVRYGLKSGVEAVPLGEAATGADGRASVVLPAQAQLQVGDQLVVAAAWRGGESQTLSEYLLPEPIRHATRATLDKPLYQPGETLHWRSLTLSRFGLAADREFDVSCKIIDPQGGTLPGSESSGATTRGVGNGAFELPEGLAGGEYVLRVESPAGEFPKEERTFRVREYRLPRLKTELEFARASYAPGDTVTADFSAVRAEGGPAAGAALRVVATVDGVEVLSAAAQAGPTGAHHVSFALPREIARGDGQLLVVVDDGGTQETAAKTIPINLGKVEVAFHPEGGDLVAGTPCRVYFAARDPLGQPVHVEGEVVDGRGLPVAKVETRHEGRGRFAFEPKPGESYTLRIDKPQGIALRPALPAIAPQRTVALTVGPQADGTTSGALFAAGAPLTCDLRSLRDGQPLAVAVYCRGVPVGCQTLTARSGLNRLSIELAAEAAGVLRVTAYDCSVRPPRPVAERLAYRRPGRTLKVAIADASEQYAPGEHVALSLIVRDESGRGVPAILGVAATDDALLNLADDKSPSTPTHFLLTSEVEKPEDLEEADFFLSDETKHGVAAGEALDLLLGVQGWRRFVTRTLDVAPPAGPAPGEPLQAAAPTPDPAAAEALARLASLDGEAGPPVIRDTLIAGAPAVPAPPRVSPLVHASSLFSVACGATLIVALGLLAALRATAGLRVVAPVAAAALACLTLGLSDAGPVVEATPGVGPVAFANYAIAPPPPVRVTTLGIENYFHDLPMAAAGAAPEDRLALNFRLDELKAGDIAGEDKFRWREGRAKNQRNDEVKKLAALEDLRDLDDAKKKDFDGRFFGGRGRAFGRAAQDFKRELPKQKGLADRLFEGEAKEAAALLAADEAMPQQQTFEVREYAHRHVRGEPGVRSDFAESLYWHPLLIADAEGRARVEFDLADSVTTIKVRVDAHGAGRLGGGSGEVLSRIPFSLEPKLPLEVTAGDRIDLPVAVNNDTAKELPISLALGADRLLTLDGSPVRALDLAPRTRSREYFALTVTGEAGEAVVDLRGAAGDAQSTLADGVRRTVRVVPPGFPRRESYAGVVKDRQELSVPLPADWVPGSLEVSVKCFPTPLADLQQGMENILGDPYGCFEQASTSNYPNVLALDYLDKHDVANPELTRRSRELLDKGYKLLIGYECKEKGYEWFGGTAPGHEALTAYGLMEFRDMAAVYPVDPAMVERTRAWLASRRDGRGGFLRNPQALDSFGGAPPEITDAYIVWALVEAGRSDPAATRKELEAELARVTRLARESQDPYLIALAAGSLQTVGDTNARELLDKLVKLQKPEGWLEGTAGSITRSGGQALRIETTALAAMAWIKSPAHPEASRQALLWLVGQRSGGGFGSTQATILALKALVAQAEASRRTTSAGALVVERNGELVGRREFVAGETQAIAVAGLEAKLQPGANELTLTLSGAGELPYALDVSYRSRRPDTALDCAVKLETKLASEKVAAGRTVALTAKLTNVTDAGQPMTIAAIGIPAGLRPRVDQLDELKKARRFDFYELNAREIVLYWRALAPRQSVDVNLDLVAEIPGRYVAPASRAYLYYTAEKKQWTEPLVVEIARD